jgi:hypothetical protein
MTKHCQQNGIIGHDFDSKKWINASESELKEAE